MRNTFLTTLVDLAAHDARICLVVGDLGFSVVEPFRDRFGPRFLNAGIAEQNMTGVAAGMAMTGCKVFTYSIANFPTLRCLEQIRNDICYHGADVTVVAVGGGLAYGALGYSHHAVQDLACLRGFPGLRLATPADPFETIAVVRYLCSHPGPNYLRLGKGGEPHLHVAPPEIPGPGPIIIRPGAGRAILACGTAAAVAMEAAAADDTAVFSCPIWDESAACHEAIIRCVAGYRRVVTVEDHLVAGGFGSFVRECLETRPDLQARVRCCALDASVCGHVAGPARLRELGGVTAARLRALLDTAHVGETCAG